MSTTNVVRGTSTVDCFAFEQLNLSTAWVAIHKGRTYTEVGVPNKPGEPFGVIRTSPIKAVLFTGQKTEYIGKIATRLEVVSVRVYENGKGAWTDFDAAFDAIRQALTGKSCIIVHDASGNEVGCVYQSRYLDEIKRVHEDGDYKVLHRGIALHVIHI